MQLIIARHGNNFDKGDRVLRMGKRTDLPLSQSGLAQASALATHLAAHYSAPATIYTSNLLRTKQTAAPIQTAYGGTISLIADSRFDEVDYGPDEGMPEEQVVARLGKETLEAWEKHAIVPDGWQINVVAIRQQWLAFSELLLQNGEDTIVVTSNGIARFSPVLVGLDANQITYPSKIGTGAFCRLLYENNAWAIHEWNIRP
jgi:2,3-bisphosphoglycerate-dependent phosphoglycerate mutase